MGWEYSVSAYNLTPQMIVARQFGRSDPEAPPAEGQASIFFPCPTFFSSLSVFWPLLQTCNALRLVKFLDGYLVDECFGVFVHNISPRRVASGYKEVGSGDLITTRVDEGSFLMVGIGKL